MDVAATASVQTIGAQIGAERARLYEVGLKKATLTAVEVASEHQGTVRRAMKLAQDLLAELECATELKELTAIEVAACRDDDAARAAAIDKMLGARGRVETLDRWAGTLAKLTAVEREAHGMNTNEQRTSMDDLLIRLAAERDLRNRRAA
jgi:hypothetical protein